MLEIENYVEKFLLDDIVVRTEDKVLKRGILKIFSTKQFYLRLVLRPPNSEKDRLYEIPYPFEIEEVLDGKGLRLQYKLHKFTPEKELLDAIQKIKEDQPNSPSRIFNKDVYILPSHLDDL